MEDVRTLRLNRPIKFFTASLARSQFPSVARLPTVLLDLVTFQPLLATKVSKTTFSLGGMYILKTKWGESRLWYKTKQESRALPKYHLCLLLVLLRTASRRCFLFSSHSKGRWLIIEFKDLRLIDWKRFLVDFGEMDERDFRSNNSCHNANGKKIKQIPSSVNS